MKAKIAIVLLLVLIGLCLEIWMGSQPSTIADTPRAQTETAWPPSPLFVLTTRDGHTVNLKDYKGKTILLNFWATWCAPCIAEFPSLVELAHRNPDDLVLLAVSVDETPENIPAFLKRFAPEIQDKAKAPNIVIGLDPQKKIAQDLFGTILFPETFIIGPDLTIRRKIAGDIDWTGPDMAAELEKIRLAP